MFIQSKVLHCEHVFDLFFSLFSLLQNKDFIDVNVHANGYTILLFVYLIQNIFYSTNKIRCVHDFCRKHLRTSLLPYHQKKESLYFFLTKSLSVPMKNKNKNMKRTRYFVIQAYFHMYFSIFSS